MVSDKLKKINKLISSKEYKEALYYIERLLQTEPNSFFNHYLKGLVLHNMEQFEDAVEWFKSSISLKGDFDDAYNNLGVALKKLGDLEGSEVQLRLALKVNPKNIGFYQNLGSVLIEQKKYTEAEIVLKKAISLDPKSWRVQYKIGELYEKMDRVDDAFFKYKELIKQKINPILGLVKSADLYKKKDDAASALKYYEKANELIEEKSPIKEHIAKSFIELNQLEKALKILLTILPLRNYRVDLVLRTSEALQKANRIEEAKDIIKSAIKLHPNAEILYFKMGNIFKTQNIFSSAIIYYQKAIKIKTDFYEAYSNLGNVYIDTGKYNAATKALKKALKLNKEQNYGKFSALLNLGNTEITIKKFKEGWEKYEYRWKVDPGDKVVWPLKDKPLWDGKSASGVLLWREQGIGDDIIFLGLVPEAYEKAGKDMTVLIDPRLVAMCERSMPGIEFLPAVKGSVQEDRFDYHLPMGSLPRLFRSSEEDFSKTRESYLKADMERVEVLRKELGVEGKKVIGISWRSFSPINVERKSMDLEQFGRMFDGLDVVLLNLQYGDVNEEIRAFTKGTGIEVLQCSSVNLKEDLDGLGALIALCDLVVSTSNVTIHMAGALGKEAWVLLPFAASFWWLIERTDSLWYPTVKLYRQKSLQDWSEILKVVRSDLDQRFEKQ